MTQQSLCFDVPAKPVPADPAADIEDRYPWFRECLGVAIHFPAARSFSDLFVAATSDKEQRPERAWRNGVEISPLCVVRGHAFRSALYVTPTDAVLDGIGESMLDVNGGVFFEIVVRDDGSALVLAQYNCILGSRWLALIDPATVPAEEPEAEDDPPAPPAPTLPTKAPRKVRAARPTAEEPTKRLTERQQELLSNVAVEGNRAVYMPMAHVPDWKALKLVVETLGGTWRKGGKARRSGWDFADDVDAAEVIRLAQERGEILDLRAAGFFETPDALADKLVRFADIPPNAVVLEPSAGRGRIALAVRRRHPDARILCCELLDQNRAELERIGFELVGRDFLALDPAELPEVTTVCANPPFARFAEVEHVEHMHRCVRPGGRVASIMSSAVKHRDAAPYQRIRALLAANSGTIADCPDGSFLESGTGVSTVMVGLTRAA